MNKSKQLKLSHINSQDNYYENLSSIKLEKTECLNIIIKQFNLNKNNLPYALLTAGSLVNFGITDPAFVCADLNSSCQNCKKCELSKSRTNVVTGRGKSTRTIRKQISINTKCIMLKA